jgi:polysaccharide biosynthesis protein PslG
VDVQGQGPRVGACAGRLGAVFCLLLVALAAPSVAKAERSEFYGIVQTATLDERDFQGMHRAHVRTNRFILNWGAVERSPGKFKWDFVDRFIGELASHGIRAVPSVWGNPSWLPGSSSTPPVGGAQAEQRWRAFLKAAVARYRPGGVYWTRYYRKRFGPNAPALPVQSWQIWNEPNLRKYFAPYPSPGKYARLLQISYPTIKGIDRHARVVLAGMPGYADVNAWTFLANLYSVPGIKAFFDAVAIHPYGANLNRVRQEIQRTRDAMKHHGDAATPLWVDEIAWGSAPPDRVGINKGPAGQAQMLRRSFKLILKNRAAWNIQHLFWYHWRDPRKSRASCTFCGSAGLLRFNRTGKPSLKTFKRFAADRVAPTASITRGPPDGRLINDATPTFKFASSELGSTFQCHFDSDPFVPCTSPYTPLAARSNDVHTFYVRAVDAPGNVSEPVSRTFTVDTIPPPTPKVLASDPPSPANDNNPKIKGQAAAGTVVKLYVKPDCSGPPVAQASTAVFGAPGIKVTVPDNTATSFRATATDAAGNPSTCSSPLTYVEDSTSP